ncbi:acyltransferase [Cellvibrio sp. KY-GH-1]|uniref:acyltransferase family protein n=1 Tax=Cellvibrio sp. KY-GH-1 TaxID=2303332 RepID=UPI001245F9F4|nr:acyltransferase [Cellvibrio sp. KY-GH-1]QEY18181.1 acyltransferase [Cellvibrio sp. KY-GH-1]
MATYTHAEKHNPTMEKMPNLDGLRALACLFVVVSHIPKEGYIGLIGSVGVGVFFTLSGFLMGYLYAHQTCNSDTLRHYMIARFTRIVPIYWLVISLCILLSLLEGADFPLRIDSFTSIIRHYGLAGNVGPFWSIPLEIQYYLFFVVIWYSLSLRQKMPWAFPLAGFLCAVLIVTNDLWPNLSLPNKLHFFLAGTLAALMPRNYWKTHRGARQLIPLQLLALAAILFPLTQDYSERSFYDSVGLSIAFASAIYILSFNSKPTGWLLASRPLRKIGQASFSIYLIHVLVLYYGAHVLQLDHHHFQPLWLLVAALATALPMLVSQMIEMPLQRKSRALLERIFSRKLSSDTPANNRNYQSLH